MSKSDDFKNALYNALKRDGVSDKWMKDHLIVETVGFKDPKKKKKTKHK